MRRLTAQWGVLAFFALVFHGTTTASAATFTYDVQSTMRVEVHGSDDAPARSALLSGPPAESAGRPVEARGIFSTSPHALLPQAPLGRMLLGM